MVKCQPLRAHAVLVGCWPLFGRGDRQMSLMSCPVVLPKLLQLYCILLPLVLVAPVTASHKSICGGAKLAAWAVPVSNTCCFLNPPSLPRITVRHCLFHPHPSSVVPLVLLCLHSCHPNFPVYCPPLSCPHGGPRHDIRSQ